MKLKSLLIKKYRSIEEINFDIFRLDDGSYTYGLIGENEVGKSSVLKGLALKDGLINKQSQQLPVLKDFRGQNNIEVEYIYELTDKEAADIASKLKADEPVIEATPNEVKNITVTYTYLPSDPNNPGIFIKSTDLAQGDREAPAQEKLKQLLLPLVHKTIFWTAEDKYLITQPINLGGFADNLDISIPLKSCFYLLGLSDQQSIKERISLISDSVERASLREDLAKATTKHINGIWKTHPIEVDFDISDGLINFHIKDRKTTSRAKTTDQRSDGFGQFVSFLLSISAQNRSGDLKNTLVLIDEPETHLHPKAQEELLQEFISMTKSNSNNICFFATHSNYMIDKKFLNRNYRLMKKPNSENGIESTTKDTFDQTSSTYASVTYDVFEIESGEYHDELFGKLHANYIDQSSDDEEGERREKLTVFDKEFLKSIQPKKDWTRLNGKIDKNVALPTYIRNCLHHPEAAQKHNQEFTLEELKNSIETLKKLL